MAGSLPQTLLCDIVSAEEELFSGEVEMVIAAADQGDVGIRPGHAAMLTALKPGPVRLKLTSGEEEVLYVSGGYLEVQPHVVTVLADTAMRGGDMDESAAAAAVAEASKQLSEGKGDIDFSLAAARLAEASAQLRTLKAMRKKLNR